MSANLAIAPAPKHITVNGQHFAWHKPHISHAEVVALAGADTVHRADMTMTWRYRDGQAQHGGTLRVNESVHVHDGMVFNVAFTGDA